MSSRTNKSLKSTPVKGKNKKQEQIPQIKRRKEDPSKKVVVAKGKRSAAVIKPVAKIPSSREDSSSNWKALLQKQGKPLPTLGLSRKSSLQNPMDSSKDVKRFRDSGCSDSGSISTERSGSVSHSRCSSQLSMTSEAASSNGTDNFDTESEAGCSAVQKDSSQKVKQEFRALGLSESKAASQRQSRERGHKGLPRRIVKKPPAEGLNEFGYFDYSHYGVLKTPITPAHAEFMLDTGIIAMDCEMVGVGPMKESALARVSIVNEYGYCLYDRFVKPKLEVTDYRTQFSGIRENDLRNATPFQIVAKEVSEILKSHILVGHSLKSDLAVLFLSHPKAKIRDTAFFFKKILHSKTPKLKMLVKKLLGVEIQQGEHSSITDAQATMALYQLYQKEWEISVRQSNRGIDVLKITLDEFKQLNGNLMVPTQPTQPQTAPYYAPSQHLTKGDWYDHPDVFNSASYCSTEFSACVEGCCGDSAGVSPSESPPASLDLADFSIRESTYPCHQVMDDIGLPCPQNNLPPNFAIMQYQNHSAPPMPPPPVPMPFYQYGAMNGMIMPPPMSFPPPPPMMLPPPPPSHFMAHPSMMIPVFRPIHCFPMEYNYM